MNAERLVRQSRKWEKQRALFEQSERTRESQMKIREMELLRSEAKLNEDLESRGVQLATVYDQQYRAGEIDLENFLKNESDLMANRLKSNETKFDPYTKDLRLVDAK